MSQATLELDVPPADAGDRTGFELGWDHAHHGLVPPAELLLDGSPVSQGWRAAKAVFGRRTLAAPRAVRQWLGLRTQAWQLGIAFAGTQVSAHYLARIEATHCPVMRRALGGAAGNADAPVVERLNRDAGYVAGNLAVVSLHAADARAGLRAAAALRRAARVEAGIEDAPPGLDVAQAWRLAVLASFATPLPYAVAARVPMRVLPPDTVVLLNAVQGLQVLVTLQFTSPGWSERLRALAGLLPLVTASPDLRLDFNLLVGALAPRVLETGPGAEPRAVRRALEDAWADPRVNRRWQHFALALGEVACGSLLARAAAAGLSGSRTPLHAPAQATEGWALAFRGRRQAAPRRAPRVAASEPVAPVQTPAPARS